MKKAASSYCKYLRNAEGQSSVLGMRAQVTERLNGRTSSTYNLQKWKERKKMAIILIWDWING